MKWVSGPSSLPQGAETAFLEREPTKAGPHVLRLKPPDGHTTFGSGLRSSRP